MKYLTIIVIVVLSIFSCQNPASQKEKNEEIASDTVETSPIDTADQIVIDSVPKQAVQTQTFMEFFSQFMWDKDFQKESIIYPINLNEIEIKRKSNWRHNDFYTSKSSMPILHFDTLTYYDKDIKEKNIRMHILSFKKDTATTYSFSKKENSWNLANVSSMKLDSLSDYDFINFLTHFSSDSIFQFEHIQFPLTHYFADYDNDYETTSDPIQQHEWKQWNLIESVEGLMILDIDKRTKYRSIFFRGIENGIYVKYTFTRVGNSWELVKLENYST
jgi:hypothetical protein